KGVIAFHRGDKISGWTIEEITSKSVTLQRNDMREKYSLFEYPPLPEGSIQPALDIDEKIKYENIDAAN
ncbi:MAG: hypothetical protein ABJN51_04820, partial [Sneathiella sp.]